MDINDIIKEYDETHKLKSTPKPDEKIFYSRSAKGGSSEGGNFSGKNSSAWGNLSDKKSFKVVVIKNLSNLNFEATEKALYYIMLKSESDKITNENGEEFKPSEIYNLWKIKFTDNLKSKEALHLVFSIDELKNESNYEALEKSVVATLKSNFYEYQYVYALHKHQGKPHIHVIINKRSLYTNKKIHFKTKSDCKNFYDNLKSDFRDNLNYFNKDFNYRNVFKIDKKFTLDFIKKELKSINDRKHFFKIRLKENNQEFIENEKMIESVKLKLKENITINNIPPLFNNQALLNENKFSILNTTLAINRKLSLHKHFKNQLKSYNKNSDKILLKRKKYMYLKEKFESNKTLNIEEALKYFNAPSQKKLLTLKENLQLRKHLKSYSEVSNYFDNEFKNIIIDESNELDFLSTKMNSFKIHKLLRQCDKRQFINENVTADKELKKTITDNKKLLQKLFIKRIDRVDILIKEFERKNSLNDVSSKEKQQQEKIIDYLNIERNFINKISVNDSSISINKIDDIQFIKTFNIEVNKFNDKTSAYKIDKFLIECNHRIDTTNTSSYDKHKLKETKNKLRDMFIERKDKNIKSIKYLENIYNTKNNTEKEKIDKSIKFFIKEIKFIENIYEHDIKDRIKESKFDSITNEIKKFNDKTSAYRIEKYLNEIDDRLKIKIKTYEVDELTKCKIKLKDMYSNRAMRNYKHISELKQSYWKTDNLDTKKEIMNNVKILRKEIEFTEKQTSIKKNHNNKNKDFER